MQIDYTTPHIKKYSILCNLRNRFWKYAKMCCNLKHKIVRSKPPAGHQPFPILQPGEEEEADGTSARYHII
ncbi:hypothetical protein DET65_4164 [Sunxiuqinia elliptica]|uniref:Uncharacterized protein n=1 Tax=Sunxiuqinia elliptica TaxID=655355 RepID=A0A4R6GV72_9BACT|nr:hypothetical protein DET52_107299 [Sunxiuqinia elliptica]TDO56607.1 hypothetical protein DET65_4164 [Sunxiuqinia elliptica]